MANYAEEKLIKITTNIYKKDFDLLKDRYPRMWSIELRNLIRKALREPKDENR